MSEQQVFQGQARQDKYVVNILKGKKNGYFIELGSSHPININNTYILEKDYGWRGIMIEYSDKWLSLYNEHRNNSVHIIDDATKIDYKKLFEENNVPSNIDYLQIDLEESDGSTIKSLEKLDNEVLDKYKFATITFEHDIYGSNLKNTRIKSRKIFKRRGYVCVFEDIGDRKGKNPYEDWYVHPELVDMDYIQYIQELNKKNYKPHHITGKVIGCRAIEY